MSPSLRIILDTNVWYSAVIYGGLPERVLLYCLDNCSIICSEALISEIMGRLRTKAAAPQRWRRRFRLALSELCEVISVEESDIKSDIRDPEDLHILAAAVEGQCDLIITGDKDLLELGRYRGVDIITPAQFLKLPTVKTT